MFSTYLPNKIHIPFIVFMALCFLFGFWRLVIFLGLIYSVVLFLMRKKRDVYLDNASIKRGIVFSPVSGTITDIQYQMSSDEIGENLTRIRIVIPWWKESGLYFPIAAEIINLLPQLGRSIFRYMREIKSDHPLTQMKLIMATREGFQMGMEIVKCPFGFWPRVGILPGDRGKARANFGQIPLGGTVFLFLPGNFDILINQNNEVLAGETPIAGMSRVLPDDER